MEIRDMIGMTKLEKHPRTGLKSEIYGLNLSKKFLKDKLLRKIYKETIGERLGGRLWGLEVYVWEEKRKERFMVQALEEWRLSVMKMKVIHTRIYVTLEQFR